MPAAALGQGNGADASSRCGRSRWLEEQQQSLVGRTAGWRADGGGLGLALQNAGHARQQRRRRAAQRPGPGLARVRHSPLHLARDQHGASGTGSGRLDSARNRDRRLVLRAAGDPQHQQELPTRLPHPGNAAFGAGYRGPLCQQPSRSPSDQHPAGEYRQSQLADNSHVPAAADRREIGGHRGLDRLQRKCRDPARPVESTHRLPGAELVQRADPQRPVTHDHAGDPAHVRPLGEDPAGCLART